MFGERLAELRKLNDDTQQILADKIGFSVWAVRAWEQEKNLPPSDALLAICKLYGTSADYLLGLTDIDPSDEARKQRQRLTEEEQNEMHRYEEYLLWKRKNKPPSETVKVAGRLFSPLDKYVKYVYNKIVILKERRGTRHADDSQANDSLAGAERLCFSQCKWVTLQVP